MSKQYRVHQSNPRPSTRSTSPFSPTSFQNQSRKRSTRLLILILCFVLVTLAGCGPERAGGDAELVAETHAIARQFAATGDLEAARRSLSELDVANGNQWLIYVAETAIADGGDMEVTTALVQLSEALGLDSAPIEEFALQHNLVEGLAAAVEAAPEVGEALVAAGEAVVAPLAEQAAAAENTDASSPAGENAEAVTAATTDTDTDTATVAATEEGTGSALPVPTATPTADAAPAVRATLSMNVRSGPDTTYDIVGLFDENDELNVVGKNADGSWWQVELADGQQGWVYGQLVEQKGSFDAVAVAANIPPPPPPTATPEPVAVAEPAPADAPPADQPAEGEPAAPAEGEAAPPAGDPNATPHFTLVQRRLWSKQENGGCAGQHLLRINVVDANGVRLNGVALKGIYIGEVLVTGDQGKGDGVIEYDLHGSGEGFYVMRNNDGREATSDRAEGFTTRSLDISKDVLIEAGYCSNDSDCDIFYGSYGCHGHHSYEATFQRNY